MSLASYTLPLVGEQHYQPALARLSVGQTVHIVHETGNPYDEEALAVFSGAMPSDKLGYVPAGCWLHEAVFEEGKGALATVKEVQTGERGFIEAALFVQLNHDGITERAYQA